MRPPESNNPAENRRLGVRGSTILGQDRRLRAALYVEWHALRPVDLEDLLGQLSGGDHLGGGACPSGVLHAQVNECQEDGILVGGSEGALVEEREDFLGQRDRPALVPTGRDRLPPPTRPPCRKSRVGRPRGDRPRRPRSGESREGGHGGPSGPRHRRH